ncbi:MAG: V-type ATPase subunit [Candidatus Helarchaeota archaeon]
MIHLKNREMDIEYLIPIVSAEKPRLLKQEKLVSLTKLSSIEEFVNELKDLKYNNLIEYYKPESIESIEFVLKEYLISLYIKFLKSSPLFISNYIYQEFLKFEMDNLKKLYRAKILNYSYSEIDSLIHHSIEKFLNHEKNFERLMHASSLLDLINSITFGNYKNDLQQAFHIYEESKSIYMFDVFLDLDYFKNLIIECKNLKNNYDKNFVLNYLKLIINGYNVLAIFRTKKLNLKAHQIYRFMIYDPNITNEILLENLINSKSYDINRDLGIINKIFKSNLNINEVDSLDKLYYILMRKKYKFFVNSLSLSKLRLYNISYPLAVLKLTEYEINNLIIILNGINLKMTPSDIKNNLILNE